MKIRFGFVSNSSSSSFVCSIDRYPSVFSLAEEMIKIRNDDWTTDSYDRKQMELTKISEANRLNVDPCTPVMFDTTNYDTYIRLNKKRKLLEISTCDNHDWSSLDTASPFYEDDEDAKLSISVYKTFFWHLREGLVGRPLKGDDAAWTLYKMKNASDPTTFPLCTKREHYMSLVEIPNKEIICPVCYWESLKPDMVLAPAKKQYLSQITPIRSRIKLR